LPIQLVCSNFSLKTHLRSVAYFPRLVELKEKIKAKITAFFYETCLPALRDKYSEFIIDFGLIGDDYDQVAVIELNEFMDTTDGNDPR
jgi:hypothetical protein